jgi:hypothetical protein
MKKGPAAIRCGAFLLLDFVTQNFAFFNHALITHFEFSTYPQRRRSESNRRMGDLQFSRRRFDRFDKSS